MTIPRGHLLPLTVLSLVAITIFCWFGITRSLWLDDAISVLTASRDLTGIISATKIDTDPPLYYLLLSAWIRAFGISELAVKSLSAVFYILSLPAIFALGKAIYKDTTTGLLCSFLYMVSPMAIAHTQTVRQYSLLGLLSILSIYLFVRLFPLRALSRGQLSLYVIVNVLGTFTHYWFLFTLISQIICYLILYPRSSPKRFAMAISLSVAPFAALWFPLLLGQAQTSGLAWLTKPGLDKILSTLVIYYGGKRPALAVVVYGTLLALILVRVDQHRLKLQDFAALKQWSAQRQSLALAILFAGTLLVPWVVSQFRPVFVAHRYTVIALPPLIVLIAGFLRRFASRRLLLGFCYVLLIGFPLGTVYSRSAEPQYSDRMTSVRLLEEATEGDLLIFTSLSRPAIDYYLRLFGHDHTFTEVSFPQENELHPGWRDVQKYSEDKYSRELEAEANSLMEILEETVRSSGKKIWLFYGFDTEISNVLKHKLEASFELVEEKDLMGSLYDKILVYQGKEGY